MAHLSEQLLKSTIKIKPNREHKDVIAYLIYLSDELDNVKEKVVATGNTGVFSIFNGIEIESELQYIKTVDLTSRFGVIDLQELAQSKIEYAIKGNKSVLANIFEGTSISDNEFGFQLNISSITEAVKDFEFYHPRGRFDN